ncbi:cytochrome c [Chitinophagaceae bacterium 26-R-25]|nr:cytochrome c [Chitinophagaceae bacterium 26-R-25]
MKKIIISLGFITGSTIFLAAQTSPSSIDNGQKIYAQYCLTCHQADGSGVPNMNPPLIKTSYVIGSKQKLIHWVLTGSIENVPIDGKDYSNNMPPQYFLKDEELASVLTYIRSHFGNKASAITAAEVKAVRSKTK